MVAPEIYMHRALELARNGAGKVSPNPMVGCVIVHNGTIIGEGWHQQFGGPHAEPNAIAAVNNQELLKDATLYVTLEPCAHFGKTPPCAHLIIEKQIPRVVVCNLDPNPLVAGKGIKLLKDAGIEVKTGILAQEGAFLNRRFFTYINHKRPFIILKWAETADGFVARENCDSKWISNALSRKLVHKWRTEEDAILVGKNTALYDNPQLTSRDWEGKNPIRIVIDKNLDLPQHLYLFDKSVKTICFNTFKSSQGSLLDYQKVDFNILGQEVVNCLFQQHIQSVIIEGGSATLQYFIDANLWDEARVFVAPVNFEQGIKAPKIKGTLVSETTIATDTLRNYTNHHS